MAVDHAFARNDVFPSWIANRLQDMIGASQTAFRLRKVNSTTVGVAPPEPQGVSSITLQGRWRFRDTDVTRAHPGGGAGTYDIYAVALDNDVDNTPDPYTDHTDYTFDLRIVSSGGTPSGAGVEVFEKVGEADWNGTAITALRQTSDQTTGAQIADGAISGSGATVTRQSDGSLQIAYGAGSVDGAALAASVAGNGLAGGAGSALSVNAGSGLEVSGDAVRIAASAAGAGLTGGAGAALDVGAGTGINVAADSVAINQAFAPTWTGVHTFAPTGNPTTGVIIGATVSTATASAAQLSVGGSFTGSGASPSMLSLGGTYSPSTNVSLFRELAIRPDVRPGSGVTITDAEGIRVSPVTGGSAGGVITTYRGLNVSAPVYGTVIPATMKGIEIGNMGAAGVGTAIGIDVTATGNATTNIGVRIAAPAGGTSYALQLSDTGGTAAGGITFGTDTTLYRAGGIAGGSGAAVKTDNALWAAQNTTTNRVFLAGGAQNANRYFAVDGWGQVTNRYDNNSLQAFTMINGGIGAANQGFGFQFQFDSAGVPADAGYIRMISEANWGTTPNSDSAITFGTALDRVVAEVARFTSGGTLQLSSTNNPASYINVTGNNAITSDAAGLNFQPTYTGAGGAFGLRGIVINASFNTPSGTLSEATGIRNRPTFNPTTGATISNSYAMYGGIVTGSAGGALTNVHGLLIDNGSYGSIKPSNTYGVKVGDQGSASITTTVGVDVAAQGNSATTIGVRVAKPTGATSYALQLSDTGGTAAGGITFGTDTTLYRSTNDVLKTDDALVVDGASITLSNDASSARSIVVGTTNGLKIGTATTQKLGFFNATPVVRPSAYTPTNVSADRSYDANSTSIDELADVLGTLIADLQALGLVG